MFICQLFFERLFDIFFIYGIINLNKRMRGKKMRAKSLEKQKKILDFVNRQVQEKGYPPSVREICKAVGFKSTSTVHAYLASLEAEGLISKEPAKTRALKVIDENSKTLKVAYPTMKLRIFRFLGRLPPASLFLP